MSHINTATRFSTLHDDLDMEYSQASTSFVGTAEDNKDFNVAMVEITCDNEIEWDVKIGKLQTELKRRRNL